MNRKWIAAIVIVIIIAGAGIAIAVGGNNNNDQNNGGSNQNSSATTPPATPTPPASSSQSTASNKVSISNFAFSPADITVKKDTTVTWTNNDSTPHQPTADSGSGPASQPLASGQTYSFTYSTVGTFAYHCAIHPEMHGTVTVTE